MDDYSASDGYTACACCGADSDGSYLCYQCEDVDGPHEPATCPIKAMHERRMARLPRRPSR